MIGKKKSPASSPSVASGKSEVSALWVSRGAAGYGGGLSRVRIGLEKNTNRELRVGFFEEEVGGSGPMWRAAGWMAVIMSGFLLGIDPADYRFTYEVGGYIDGPSAGALPVGTVITVLGKRMTVPEWAHEQEERRHKACVAAPL